MSSPFGSDTSMMPLHETYAIVKQSIVAFCAKYQRRASAGDHGFPFILGTGFVVHPDGLIATNHHVIESFRTVCPEGLPDSDYGVDAVLLHRMDHGLVQVPLEIIGLACIKRFVPGEHYCGPPRPDIAFVQVKAKGLPSLHVAPDFQIVEGIELATAGYPMGTDALAAPGYVHQITPTLQKGIVSAVLPFACDAPHAFAVNVMSQGGASGSPVFDPSSGHVVGVLYAGLCDFDVTPTDDLYRVPTAISHVVPARLLSLALDSILPAAASRVPSDAATIDDLLRSKALIDARACGRIGAGS